MGITYITGVVTGPTGLTANVRFLLDSGACSVLGKDTRQAIGLEPKRSASFPLADGTRISRQISECI